MQPPKQRDADRSRAAILDAAESLFAERGFEAITMAQIGAAAGVSRGTPGYFFGTKEALYRVVVGRAAATMRMLAETLRVRDAVGARDPAQRVGETVDAFLSLLVSRSSLVRLIDREHGIVAGEPHAEALRDALQGLGPDRDRVALITLALCWFPVAHPDTARLLGVDPDDPGFAEVWRAEVVASLGQIIGPDAPAAAVEVRTPQADEPVPPSAHAAHAAHAAPAAPAEPGAKKPKKKKKKKPR